MKENTPSVYHKAQDHELLSWECPEPVQDIQEQFYTGSNGPFGSPSCAFLPSSKLAVPAHFISACASIYGHISGIVDPYHWHLQAHALITQAPPLTSSFFIEPSPLPKHVCCMCHVFTCYMHLCYVRNRHLWCLSKRLTRRSVVL